MNTLIDDPWRLMKAGYWS